MMPAGAGCQRREAYRAPGARANAGLDDATAALQCGELPIDAVEDQAEEQVPSHPGPPVVEVLFRPAP
jgi:hypothetical protein